MDTKEGIDALFLYATEGILITNDKGEIIKINPSAEKLFKYEPNELLGKKIEVLIPQRFSAHKEHRENYNDHPHARSMGAGMNLYGLKKDGTEVPVEISLSPYSNTEGKFVVAFIVDITMRKQAEERMKNYSAELEKQVKNRTMILEEAIQELEKTKKDLHNALDKEKDLSELKSRFVSMASHEFRTPLTTMMSSLSLVTKYGEQNDKVNQSKHVTKIKTSINNLTDILNDFLSVSKLEEGKVENMPEEIHVKNFIAEVISEMKSMATQGQLLVHTHSGNETAMIDKKFLKNVLFNLISNAIKFSPEKGIVDILCYVSNSSLKIIVKDNGIGIPKADQEHLFERFFRGHNATHIQGTGLGLNIVARYAELMNGSIDVESEENKGTTFTMIIPQ
ncbi:MAG: sensor histidine kinase [Bacteroidetes bacterium]|jgi:PAS domain S-box-containing protein|nr:sensor histidine kinase [Bacteroidota bacterium]MDF2450581.1 sensor histidine kinase [Bacteroidota bacterium]